MHAARQDTEEYFRPSNEAYDRPLAWAGSCKPHQAPTIGGTKAVGNVTRYVKA
jgi:hypothetical protein